MGRPAGLDRSRGLPPDRLRRVLDHIESHLGESITQRHLAGLAQLSMDHFARLFRHSIGVPPHRYMLQRRIARARELVADRRLSLAEIGYELGFPSQAHFTTMFRRLVGATPGAYRCMTRSGDLLPHDEACVEYRTPQRKSGRPATSLRVRTDDDEPVDRRQSARVHSRIRMK